MAMEHGTRVVDIVLKRNKPMAVRPSTTELEPLFAKLPKRESWSFTIDVHFLNFSPLGYTQCSELRHFMYHPSDND